MNIYEVVSENIIKCDDCKEDIKAFKRFYMFAFAQNKNNGGVFYLCEECKEKLKNKLNSE